MGAKKFIEMNQETVDKFKLSSGNCLLEQDNLEINVSYTVNNILPKGTIYIPTNRRELNKFDFSKKIMITPSRVKEALNVN